MRFVNHVFVLLSNLLLGRGNLLLQFMMIYI